MRLKRTWRPIICVVACLVGCAVALLGYEAKAAANKVFSNMTYLTSYPGWFEKVTLKNGRYQWSYQSDVFLTYSYAQLFYDLSYEGHYVYGDFNQDGLRDAAVIITERSGGNACSYMLAFLINDGRNLTHRVSYGLGDRVRIISLKKRGDKVVVDMFVHRETDCSAWPTKRVKYVYEYMGHTALQG